MDIENIREKMIEEILVNVSAWELLDFLTDMRDEVMEKAKDNLMDYADDDLIGQFEDTMGESVEEYYEVK